MHPALEHLEARASIGVERNDLAVEDRLVHPQIAQQATQLGVGLGDLATVATLEPQPPRARIRDRAHAIPLDLEGPLLLRCRQGPGAREHRRYVLGQRRIGRVLRRIHPMDHPVALVLAGTADREQAVAPVQALAVEDHLDLARLPFDELKRALVPDAHRAGAVGALRDVALELQVLERVVLRVDSEPVLLRRRRDPVRDRPRGGDTVVLEPQIPVQTRRMVLLHDEPRRAPPGAVPRGRACARALPYGLRRRAHGLRRRAHGLRRRAHGLRRRGEIALGPVLVELLALTAGHTPLIVP